MTCLGQRKFADPWAGGQEGGLRSSMSNTELEIVTAGPVGLITIQVPAFPHWVINIVYMDHSQRSAGAAPATVLALPPDES